MQTLPDYPATVRRDETGNIVSTAPKGQNRQKNDTRNSSIEDSASRSSNLQNQDDSDNQPERHLEKLKREALASEGMTLGSSSVQREQDEGKFKVYGMNNAAQEFNQIVKDKNRKNKFKPKIKDWSIRQDLKKIKQQEI